MAGMEQRGFSSSSSSSCGCGCLWMWTLLLLAGSCVALRAGADCGPECARCVAALHGLQSALSALTCSLECQGAMDGQKLRLCQDFLFETDDNVSVDADPHQQPSQDSADAPMGSSRHQISKKYGGFMKRYGGFMSRRSSSAQEVPSNQESQNEEENIRLGILNIISATKDGGLEEGSDEDEEAAKSYGGFRGHGEGVVVKGNLLEAVLGHGLKKRYGGFMRRVGRPEWLLDNGKSGGALKSGWENGGGLQKRYGGFMD